MRNFMKKEVELVFKKIKPRLANVNFDKIHSARSLFAVKFSQIVTERTLIINIGEASINRHIKRDYSWIFKGQYKEVNNDFYYGSVSIIMGIWSNRYWIGMQTNECSSMYQHPPLLEVGGTCWKCLHLQPTHTWTKKCF